MAQVPDARLDALAEMSKSKNVVHAAVQFVDIGGLVEGASKGEGLGNRFLGGIREVDAIVFVLRAFARRRRPRARRPARAPAASSRSSWSSPTSRRSRTSSTKRRKAAKADRSLADEVAALERAHAALAEGTPVYRAGLERRRPRAAASRTSC